MPKLPPQYTFWDACNAALALSLQAIDEIRTLARLPGPAGKDGAPGRDGSDGKDAVVVDDITKEWLDDGRVEVETYWCKGEVFKRFERKTKNMIYRGVLDTNRTYDPGDVVTHGGNAWHCNIESRGQLTNEKWGLMLRKGRDARENR